MVNILNKAGQQPINTSLTLNAKPFIKTNSLNSGSQAAGTYQKNQSTAANSGPGAG